MKAVIFIIAIMAVSPAFAGGPGASFIVTMPRQVADASTCYTISDPDTRAYCLARAHADHGRCYSIQRQDLRAWCLSELHK